MDDRIKLKNMSSADIFLRLWKAVSPGKVVNKVYITHKGQIYKALSGQVSKKKLTVMVMSVDIISK